VGRARERRGWGSRRRRRRNPRSPHAPHLLPTGGNGPGDRPQGGGSWICAYNSGSSSAFPAAAATLCAQTIAVPGHATSTTASGTSTYPSSTTPVIAVPGYATPSTRLLWAPTTRFLWTTDTRFLWTTAPRVLWTSAARFLWSTAGRLRVTPPSLLRTGLGGRRLRASPLRIEEITEHPEQDRARTDIFTTTAESVSPLQLSETVAAKESVQPGARETQPAELLGGARPPCRERINQEGGDRRGRRPARMGRGRPRRWSRTISTRPSPPAPHKRSCCRGRGRRLG